MCNQVELFEALKLAKAEEKTASEEVLRLEAELRNAEERKTEAITEARRALNAIERAALKA